MSLLKTFSWSPKSLGISTTRPGTNHASSLADMLYFKSICELRDVKELYFDWPWFILGQVPWGRLARAPGESICTASEVYGNVVERHRPSAEVCDEVVKMVMNEMVSRPGSMRNTGHREDKRLFLARFEELIAERCTECH